MRIRKKWWTGSLPGSSARKHERDVKRLVPLVAAVNELSGTEYEQLTDFDIQAKAAQFKAEVKERLGDAEPSDPEYKQRVADALEPALVPAFALVREAGRRTLGLRHFDDAVDHGGIVLHEGKIAEDENRRGQERWSLPFPPTSTRLRDAACTS